MPESRTDPAPAVPLPLEGGQEPVFAEPWQAQLFAITVSLSEAGHFSWPEWAGVFSRALEQASRDGAPKDGSDYYNAWLAALETLLAERGLATPDSLTVLREAWIAAYLATPHGKPVVLRLD